MTGHLFIVHGDLTTIACDAILVPTDPWFDLTETWDSLELEKPERPWAKGEKVRRYRTKREQPEIWLGNIGQPGNDNEFAVYRPAVEEFIRLATATIPLEREGRINNWPKLRLALNVVGAGEGGGRERRGDLLADLVELLRSLTNLHEVDIVLAAYGDKLYAGAQRARRQSIRKAVGDRPLETADWQIDWKFTDSAPGDRLAQAEQLADAAIDNHLVLFIGAGVSAGAGLPLWKNLLERIAREHDVDDEYIKLLESHDLRDWATLIDRKLSSKGTIHQKTVELINSVRYCSLQHALLASLPSTEAVTTNFDQLFEVASRVADRDLAVLPTRPEGSSARWLLKLHGSVDDPTNMVLTRSDYLDMPRYHGALMGLVQGLLLTRHMMYVGYSLSDEDFHEIIHEVRAARGEGNAGGATMLTLAADEAQRDLWRDDLDIISMRQTKPDTDDETASAARELEIFLDLVAFLSTTSSTFFLDPAYLGLTADETELRQYLDELAMTIATPENDSVERQVLKFLQELGADLRDDSGDAFTTRITAEDIETKRIRIPKNTRETVCNRTAPQPVPVQLRGTSFSGHWDQNLADHRCAILHLDDAVKLESLVGLGERLSLSFNDGLVIME